MSKSIVNSAFLFALVLAIAAQSFGQASQSGNKEQVNKLIAVLKSDAPRKDKADACRQLALLGTKEAIAPLAALLGNEELSHMARYGLETIPDPAVDDALRDTLGKVQGRPLIGVITSIGVRRDAKAVDQLAALLQNPDAAVASAAARTLGSIGTSAAAKALGSALATTPSANQLPLCEGLFRCAEALTAKNQQNEAIAIYDRLREMPAAHQVRTGAVRGAILARQNDGLPLLRQYLRNQDYLLFAAAVRTSMEMPGADVTQALTAEMSQLPADNQLLVIQTLAGRADPAALPALFAATKNSAKPIRLASIRALPAIGNASAIPVLLALMEDGDREIGQVAQESLASLPGQEVDKVVTEMLSSSAADRQLTGIELAGRRRMTGSTPLLLKTAGSADAKVRPAAIRQLGELAGPAELPSLLDLIVQLSEQQDVAAAEQAIAAVCGKASDPEACAGKLAALLAQAPPSKKVVLVRLLGGVGGQEALTTLRGIMADRNADAQVRAITVRTLTTWKTAEVAPDLLALAQNSSNATERTLALRGYMGLARRAGLPADQRISICRQAANLIQRDDEKRQLLAATGSINAPEAVALLMPYLDDASVREEAATASVAIAGKLLQGPDAAKVAPALIKSLEKVVQVNANAELTRRAQALLQQAQSKANGK